MQAQNNILYDHKNDPKGELRRQTIYGHQSRIEGNRIILFDTNQPLKNGNHLQSTNSIFHNNENLASHKGMKKLYKKKMDMLDDIKLQYEQPERFEYANMEIVQRNMGFGSNNPSSEIVVSDNLKG